MQIASDLYEQILGQMPIPCVDLLVLDDDDNVLMLLRRNEPAMGQWWFPGGRVLKLESRREAAERKLEEECGLRSSSWEELGTFDLLFPLPERPETVHSITTLFRTRVTGHHQFQIDSQSEQAAWKPIAEWLRSDLHPFVRDRLLEQS